MALGIPFGKFEAMIEGLYQTVDVLVPQKEKERIATIIKEHGRTDLKLDFETHEENKYKGPLYVIK